MILLIFLIQNWFQPARKIRWDIVAFFVAAALLPLLWAPSRHWEIFALFLNLALILAILKIADRFFQRTNQKISNCKDKIAAIENRLKLLTQENNFYSARSGHLKSQLGARQKLASFTREMGTLLDPEKIKEKFTEKVQALFPNERVLLRTTPLTSDPIDIYVNEQKSSILIKDFVADPRFSIHKNSSNAGIKTKSAMATPLMLEKNILGLVKVDSETTSRFQESDLQQLELYAHIAMLALENALLFSRVNAMATQDGLTGLATHRIFQEKLIEELLRSARYHTALSLILLDIDHFKAVNDHYGHLSGDRVLREVGKILTSQSRAVDFAARYGGEEFAMILPEIDLAQTFEFAENLRQRILHCQFRESAQIFNVSVSIGCASFPRDAQIASQLIRKADERLYKAKSLGRNRVIID